MHPSIPPSNRFHWRSTPFYACIFFLACLVLFNVTLLTLKATHFFEKHRFDVRKISAVSRLASVATQTFTVIILIALSYAIQIASSDTIIRRRQSVAALHDNLMAWRGLGSSILSLWRSRELDIRTRLRVLLAFVFFGGVSVLHIVTPSVITVGTFNTTVPVSLNVSTILNVQPWEYLAESIQAISSMSALPCLWPQLGTNMTFGLPAGVNGSVMFSTLPSVMTEDVVFRDPYARDLSARCGIIPRISGDSFQVSYYGPGDITSFPNQVAIQFDIHTNFASYPGDMQSYGMFNVIISMSSRAFAIGGNKESIRAPPVFWFDDSLLYLPGYPGAIGTAFAYISTQNDSFKLDPLVRFPPPVQYTLQARTWSFINNDTKNAFLEDVNATFYIWPIGCSLFAQNITGDVRGDNTFLSKKTPHRPTNNTAPFLRHNIPHDPLEIAWASMIWNIYLMESEATPLLSLYSQNGSSGLLTAFEHQLGSGLNSTNDSLALLSDQLSSMTALSYALLVQSFQSTPHQGSQVYQDSSPAFATVSGSKSILVAGLTVQTLPLIIGIITSSILILVFLAFARQPISSDNVIQDGQVINMISLLHNSPLPIVIPNANEHLQRVQAIYTHVLYDGLTLDVDYIQRRHFSPSPGVPLIPLEGGNPQDENSESIGGSPSRPLHPGSDQPSQSQSRTHWLFVGHQPYIIAYTITTVFLAAFYLVLIGLWSHHLFDHTLFNIARLGQVNQFVSVLSQAWAVATLSVIAFTVQAIASDLAIQRCQTVVALHDTLGSWLGVMYAAVALFRSRDHVHTRLRLFLAVAFFVSISTLHISTPSVITVHAVNSTVPFNASVVRMPGNLSNIPVSDQTKNSLCFTLPSVAYLWGQRNSSVGLPKGYNGTTLFSTLATPTQDTVYFEDPYARNTVAQCGSVANSPHNVTIALTSAPTTLRHGVTDPGSGPYLSSLSFDLQLMVSISQNTTMGFRLSDPMGAGDLFQAGVDYSFGGETVSLDAPPHYWVNDQLVYLPWDQSNPTQPLNNMGTTAFAYISLRPDAFRTSSLGGDIPVTIERREFKVWTWIGNSSAPGPAKEHDLNITFYIWPIICSLSVDNVTAWVRVQGETRLERTNANTPLANLTTPSVKWSVPSDPMVTSWSYIMESLFHVQQLQARERWTMVELTFNQTWSLTSLEDQLAQFAAFYYSVLVHNWRTAAFNGDLTASQWWTEATGSVVANKLTLFGRLDLSISQLLLGCVCIAALIITSTISILGVRIHQGGLLDGGVMDMISLLRGSSLPEIIAGDRDNDLTKDGPRRRAERTMVMYKNSILDVPGRLEDETFLRNSGGDETTDLQSSLRAIALSEQVEDQRLPLNSGAHENTDMEYSLWSITVPEQQEDECPPFLSENPETTDRRTSSQAMLPERLEGNDVMNSGDTENLQDSLGTIAPLQRQEDEDVLNSGDPEMTGFQSSLREIALSERLEGGGLPMNSGDHTEYSVRRMTLSKQQEDGHLPLNSGVPETTDSQTFVRMVALQERLDGDDSLIDSGDHENLQNSLGTIRPASPIPSVQSG